MQLDLCRAIGIDVAKTEPMEVYLLGGKIIRDEELRLRSLKYLVGGVLPKSARFDAIKAMTQQERTALRDRVLGVLAFRSSK